LQGILASSLKRAIRDNDLVYVQPIPPVTQLASITPAAMVKPVTPAAVENSLEWLMHEGGGALFSGLVPYGVHLALSA
jgi:programmed cell death 6-interacting protein